MACLIVFSAGHAVQNRRGPGYSIPESVLCTEHDNPAVWADASYYGMTRAVAPGGYAVNDIPRTGIIEYLLVLVDFNDKHFIIDDTAALRKQYNSIFNEIGYTDTTTYTFKNTTFKGATGSVSDYFHSQSYGQYTPVFRIIGPVHMSKGYATYGKNDYAGYDDSNVIKMVREVCDSLTAFGIDLSGYARNGSIDQLSIIYAGRGENYSGADAKTIWPQTNKLSYNKNGINEIKFACSCELYWSSDSILDGIGVFCHEFSHTLGLPDYYNTTDASDSESNAAMGYWSIMDYGNYENEGFAPVGYTAFEKYSLGWMDLEEITYQGNYTLNEISRKPDPDAGIHTAFRINTDNDDQFFILENHTKTGWYKYHASEGLMVTSVDYNHNSWVDNTPNNNRYRKRYKILPADNNRNRNTNAGDLFPYMETDSITTAGAPALAITGTAGSIYPLYSIYNITRNGNAVSFQVVNDTRTRVADTPAQDISITTTDGELIVNAPAGSPLSIHDISGKTIIETVVSAPGQRISLPGHGIWIVRCGNIIRKVRF